MSASTKQCECVCFQLVNSHIVSNKDLRGLIYEFLTPVDLLALALVGKDFYNEGMVGQIINKAT